LSNLVARVLLANVSGVPSAPHYSVNHGNLMTGVESALSAASLNTAIKMLRSMKDAEGSPLDLAPSVLLVCPELEQVARALLESSEVMRSGADNLPTGNTTKNIATLVVEPRLSDPGYSGSSATAWYLFSDPSNASQVTGFLQGRLVPVIETFGLDQDVDSLAYSARCYHDFGSSLADFRTSIKSTGA
jgi:Mu-like prophage major head subunit gpT